MFVRAGDHCVQVVAHGFYRQAAQSVVAAQGDDQQGRLVACQGGIKSAATAARCFARDAGIDDVIIETSRSKSLSEQGRPSRILPNTVTGRQRVAKDQECARGEGGLRKGECGGQNDDHVGKRT